MAAQGFNVDALKSQDGLSAEVARHLGLMIVSGYYKAGDRIREVAVSKDLNVSRGSVREALLILERRYLIELEPRKGARVLDIGPERAREFYEIWIELLSIVTRNFCERWEENKQHMVAFKTCLEKIDECILDNQAAGVMECHLVFWKLARMFTPNGFLNQMLDDLEYVFRWCMLRVIHSGPTQVATVRVFLTRYLEQVEARNDKVAVAMLTGVLRDQCETVVRRILNHRDLGREL